MDKVRGHEGQFVLHQDYSKQAVFLSGGIGVTPFRSMIKYATDKQVPCYIPLAKMKVYIKNHRLLAKNDWEGEYGLIDKAMILKYLDTSELNNSIFYICGRPGMLNAMQTLLQKELKIPKERIKVEEFTGY